MEATSARMAQRHQFEGFPPPRSSLQRFIYNACDPISKIEPDLALNLEIVDLINSKKGSAPREAAVTIVQLVNHRNPNVSLLALGLLDNCVKNCGYPFHLQISTKEFLNELVRRFPERPPLRASRVQQRILEEIEEWRSTICQTSRYKEDLGFIRDMHRLLLYKGYMFPEVRRDDAAVLNPSDNLKSAEEMEEEERSAQSAKLQELIRRGTPHDLQEANKLMKVMAGYDTRNKTDYRAKAAEEVSKVQQKAKILEEMLQSVKQGQTIEEGDVFEELANALQSAHPKIQKMCEEESDDAEAVAKLLEINDSIHRTVQRYKLMKSGDIQGANNIPKGTLGTTTGVGRNADNQLSLIDFDPEPPSQSVDASTQQSNGSLLDDMLSGSAPQSQSTKQTTVEDDLLGLSLGGSTGGIALGGPSSTSDFFTSSPTPPPAPFATAQSQALPQQVKKPDYDAFSTLSQPSKSVSQIASQQRSQTPVQSQQNLDPFASLVSSGSRPVTPSRQQNGTRVTSGTSLNNMTAPPISQQKVPSTAADDEWNFVSATDGSEPTLPQRQRMTAHDNGKLKIELECTRSNHDILIQAKFTNQTQSLMNGLHFQAAVEKAYQLQLKPITAKELKPQSGNSATQVLQVSSVPVGKGTLVKIRFKASYQQNGFPQEEQGMITGLGIA